MPIKFDSTENIFQLKTPNSCYAIKILDQGEIAHIHWGGKLAQEKILGKTLNIGKAYSFSPEYRAGLSFNNLPQEYPSCDNGDFREPAYRIFASDGSMMSSIKYKSHRIEAGKPKLNRLPATYVEDDLSAQTLYIVAEDSYIGLEVILQYTVFEELDVITRSVMLKNNGTEPISLDRILSSNVDFDRSGFRMLHLEGDWTREANILTEKLYPGTKSIQSKRGTSSHQHNPMLILLDEDACEDAGDVWGFSFVYSGGFLAQAEIDSFGKTRVQMGINPFTFSWKLEPGDCFQSPEVAMVYSGNGIGQLSRTYHSLYRQHLCCGRYKKRSRPVLVNSWEAMYFDYNSDDIVKFAEKAAKLGIELVVMDDGWFGKRNNAKSSLGDWVVNSEKIPEGIEALAQRVRDVGVEFGIWFEPEMVSPDSDLYRKHPDWCIHSSDRDRNLARNQLVLDLSREEVCEYIIDSVSKILDCGKISYVKWDMNRSICNIGSSQLPPERQLELPHRYMLGLYSVLEELTQKFPEILFESCSGGGGRFDPGILYYMPQIWTSDNTDAISRMSIQKGITIVYPPVVMGCHVSTVPNHQTGRSVPLKFRGDVAMMGNFGYELDLSELTDVEDAEIVLQIKRYKEIRGIVSFGDMYRLFEIGCEDEFGVQYISDDGSTVIAFYYTTDLKRNKLKLKALDPDANYYLSEINCKGKTLMDVGIDLDIGSGVQSRVFILKK